MRILVQRVTGTSVSVNDAITGAIEQGLLLLVGITHSDTESIEDRMAEKIVKLRIFSDVNGLMNQSVVDVGGSLLAVSQFTLYADAKKGNRPSYVDAARPEQASPSFDRLVAKLALRMGKPVPTGVFGADMKVTLTNDGPVTIWLDSDAV